MEDGGIEHAQLDLSLFLERGEVGLELLLDSLDAATLSLRASRSCAAVAARVDGPAAVAADAAAAA